jgi:hypothetical protein
MGSDLQGLYDEAEALKQELRDARDKIQVRQLR